MNRTPLRARDVKAYGLSTLTGRDRRPGDRVTRPAHVSYHGAVWVVLWITVAATFYGLLTTYFFLSTALYSLKIDPAEFFIGP